MSARRVNSRRTKALHLTAKSGIQFVLQPRVWLRRFLRQVSLVLCVALVS